MVKLFSLLALFTLFNNQALANECQGGVLDVDFKNHGCPTANALGNNAARVVRNSMMHALEEVLGMEIDIKHSAFKTAFDGETTEVEGEERRELQAVDCAAWDANDCKNLLFCCRACFDNCDHCRQLDEAMHEASRLSGRTLTDLADTICEKVKEYLKDGKGLGCLKHAEVAACGYGGYIESGEA